MIINTTTIRIEDSYTCLCEIIYDLVVCDGAPASDFGHLLDGLRTPEGLTELVTKQFGLPSILPIDIMKLEQALEEGIDTVLLFTKNGKPYATVLFSQCDY